MKKSFLLSLLMVATTLLAQKPEKNKYKGYYKNIPTYHLNIQGYNLSYNIPEWVEEQLNTDTLNLELKGYNKGKDISLIFYCSEPQIKASVEKETKKVNDQTVSSYYSLITAKADHRLVMLNKDGLPVEIITVEPNLRWANKKGFSRSSHDEASKEMEKAKSSNNETVKKRYIQALAKAYQNELDNRYSEVSRETTMRVYTINAKKFNYTEFNKASQSFIEATSSENISSAESVEKINAAIAIWKKQAAEYQAGKKSKICDSNIDEINLNITMGYLALGKGDKLKEYWSKCLSMKGNLTAEGYARNFVEPMIENYETFIAQKDEPLKPMDLSNPAQKYNNMILFNTFLNFYFTEKHGNMGVIANYFPSQPQFIKKRTSTKTFDEGTIEKIKQTYTEYGKIKELKYSVEGGINDDITRNLSFKYSDDFISDIYLNGSAPLFHITYTDDDISKIEHFYSNNRKIIYDFTKAEQSKTEMRITYVDGQDKKESRRVNWVKFDDHYNVTGLFISPYSTREIKYDENKNIVEITATNLSDNTITVPFSVSADAKGNATTIEVQGMKETTEYEYIF